MERQFTATVIIIDDQRVLLIYHRKLKKWLPPGGHIDINELPTDAACREVKEETGLDIELIPQENLWVDRWNAKSFIRPYLCLLEEIPAHGDKPAHQHMDLIYLGRPIGGEVQQNHQETDGLRWFSLDEIEQLKPDDEIFMETQQILRKILNDSLIDTYCMIGK